MEVEVLVAALLQDPIALAKEMKLNSPACIVNQCDKDDDETFTQNGFPIHVISMIRRCVGVSRNAAIEQSTKDIVLFSDQDIVYEDGYREKIIRAFEENPKADMIVFNIEVEESRKTFENTQVKRVHLYNCGRYGAVSFAIKRCVLMESGIRYSTLFGGGAKYSAGEDSLFIRSIIKRGYKVYTSPERLGAETPSPSTWFKGYNEKFFFDRGVLYHFLYGWLAKPLSVRFLLAHKGTLCTDFSVKEAYKIMKKGIKQGKAER